MSFFSLRFLASILFVLNFSGGVNASDLLDDVNENLIPLQFIRKGFIVSQSELLQRHLAITPTKKVKHSVLESSQNTKMKLFFRVNTLKFEPPYDFLNRTGPSLDILQKEDGDKLLDEAKKTIFSLKNEFALFYFRILFWNALTEQIKNPDLVVYSWHKTSLNTIFFLRMRAEKWHVKANCLA